MNFKQLLKLAVITTASAVYASNYDDLISVGGGSGAAAVSADSFLNVTIMADDETIALNALNMAVQMRGPVIQPLIQSYLSSGLAPKFRSTLKDIFADLNGDMIDPNGHDFTHVKPEDCIRYFERAIIDADIGQPPLQPTDSLETSLQALRQHISDRVWGTISLLLHGLSEKGIRFSPMAVAAVNMNGQEFFGNDEMGLRSSNGDPMDWVEFMVHLVDRCCGLPTN